MLLDPACNIGRLRSAKWYRPAAASAAVVTAQRQQQMETRRVDAPAHCDLADPLTGLQQPPEIEAPWRDAYKRLHEGDLPRELGGGCCIMHCGLPVPFFFAGEELHGGIA